MKRLYATLKLFLGCSIGVFLGRCIYLYFDFIIRMLCNMFKQIQLIISFLQEFFNGFIQIFNILTTGA